MKHFLRKIHLVVLTFSVLLVISPQIMAQSRSLSILENNTNPRTKAMGGVVSGQNMQMFIYGNPGSVFSYGKKLSLSFSSEFFPKFEDAGSLKQYNISGAYLLKSKHAIFAGFRYQGGLSIQKLNEDMSIANNEIKPFDWTVDIGYAYAFNSNISAFISGTYILSYDGKAGDAYAFTLGASYVKNNILSNYDSKLTLSAKGENIGSVLDYRVKKLQYALPSAYVLGGDLMMNLTPKHQFDFAFGGRYAFLHATAHSLQIGLGTEYVYNNKYAIRLGYNYGERKTSHFNIGGGLYLNGIKVDLCYSKLLSTAPYKANTFMLGFGVDI